jgi:NADP-dependent 3-hydroxy acid dehydrogenase YdfG
MSVSAYVKLVFSPVALVTGANQGIGLEISRQIAAAGISVWMGGRDANRIGDSAKNLQSTGLSVRPLSLNVADSLLRYF